MTDQDNEQTTGGVAGKLAGKAKELTGSLVGNDDLAREGRLQQTQVAAEAEARGAAAEANQSAAEADLIREKKEAELE